MTFSHFPAVAQTFGLRINERFLLRDADGDIDRDSAEYFFTVGGLYTEDEHGVDYCDSYALRDILKGAKVPVPLPCKPKDNEEYFYVKESGLVCKARFHYGSTADLYKYKHGNCFKCRADADDWVDVFRSELGEIREELDDETD